MISLRQIARKYPRRLLARTIRWPAQPHGGGGRTGQLPLTEAIKLHREILVSGNRSAATVSNYGRIEQTFLSWMGEEAADASALTLANVRAYLSWLASSGKAPKTLHLHASALKTWGRILVDEDHLQEDPLRRLRLPKVPKRLPPIFSLEQFVSLLQSADASQLRARNLAMLLFLHDTGVRVSEMCGLHRGQVDLNAGRARVVGKGGRERLVSFGILTSDFLRMYLDGRALDAPLLFTRFDGLPLSRHAAYRQMRRLGIRAGLDGTVRVSPHTARHSWATAFARLHPGAILQLQALLGHSSLAQTMDYIRLAEALQGPPGPSVVDSLLFQG